MFIRGRERVWVSVCALVPLVCGSEKKKKRESTRDTFAGDRRRKLEGKMNRS